MRKLPEFFSRASRRVVRLKCQVVLERDFRLVADRIMDLSASGVLVGPADPVLTGERAFVSFELPERRGWLDTMATVQRVLHGRRPGEATRMLGLTFDPLGPYDRYRLRRAIEERPPIPVGARPGRRAARFSPADFFPHSPSLEC